METKVCSQCGLEKPFKDYEKRYSKCRSCRNEYQQARRLRLKEEAGLLLAQNGPPESRGDVFAKMTRENWDISPTLAEVEKRKFLLLDTRIGKIQAVTGREGPPPPCRECPAKIVAYCAETGTECQKFLRWAGPG